MQLKSYTDLEQSRKLTDILPLESADCFWDYDDLQKYHRISWFEEGYDKDSQLRLNENNVCAWSLSALLGLLPKRIEIADNVYELSVYFYGLYYWNVNNGNLLLEVKGEDNLVDACVAIFEKLDELNLL